MFGGTYDHPADSVGPSQPLSGTVGIVSRFDKSLGLEDFEEAIVAGSIRFGSWVEVRHVHVSQANSCSCLISSRTVTGSGYDLRRSGTVARYAEPAEGRVGFSHVLVGPGRALLHSPIGCLPYHFHSSCLVFLLALLVFGPYFPVYTLGLVPFESQRPPYPLNLTSHRRGSSVSQYVRSQQVRQSVSTFEASQSVRQYVRQLVVAPRGSTLLLLPSLASLVTVRSTRLSKPSLLPPRLSPRLRTVFDIFEALPRRSESCPSSSFLPRPLYSPPYIS